MDSIINRDLKEVQGEIDEILERRKKETGYGKLRLKQLKATQDKILKRQTEVSKLTGDDDLEKAYNLNLSNITLRKDLITEMEDAGVSNPQQYVKKIRAAEARRPEIERELQEKGVIFSF